MEQYALWLWGAFLRAPQPPQPPLGLQECCPHFLSHQTCPPFLFHPPSPRQTFHFAITAPALLDPFTTFGIFSWDDDSTPETGGGLAGHRELDFELGTWGSVDDPQAYQFVVQPWRDPVNLVRLPLAGLATMLGGENGPTGGGGSCTDLGPDGMGGAQWVRLTYTMVWAPGSVAFFLRDGHDANGPVIGQWSMTDAVRIPTPGENLPHPFGARVHVNLWLNDPTGAPLRGRPVHASLNSFTYIPADSSGARTLQGREVAVEVVDPLLPSPPSDGATPPWYTLLPVLLGAAAVAMAACSCLSMRGSSGVPLAGAEEKLWGREMLV